LVDDVISDHLNYFGIPPEDWTKNLRASMMELKGWSGMFHRMESHPEESPADALVRLKDFVAVQLILTRSSIDALSRHTPIDEPTSSEGAAWVQRGVPHRIAEALQSFHPSSLAYLEQTAEHREELEIRFEQSLLGTIGTKREASKTASTTPPFQLITCIDDRECSIRRHVESIDPSIETYGVAGYFGVPIAYQPSDDCNPIVLAPEGVKPSALMEEEDFESPEDHERHRIRQKRQRLISRMQWYWEKASFSPIGSLALSCLAPVSLSRLIMMCFAPGTLHDWQDKARSFVLPKYRTDFKLPYTPEQGAALLASTFRDIGLHSRLAPIVLVLGHGSTSVNNPYTSAYNCGACGGREGAANARLFARIANDPSVRSALESNHNISIPSTTWFVGGLHNTTTDTITYFDSEVIPPTMATSFEYCKNAMDISRGLNALERCDRFHLARHVKEPAQALEHVKRRAYDASEVRPELNHSTNAGVVIGRREMTKSRTLDRRVFLPSYDPHGDDEQGTHLEHVLAPALNVCSGINLEYLFSTIDQMHAAGTKAPLNVVGNVGVLQGTSGDLRTGLPSQMTEAHIPVRALFLVDSPVSRVQNVLARRPDLEELVKNEWVRFYTSDPDEGTFHHYENGEFTPVEMNGIFSEMGSPLTHNDQYSRKISEKETAQYRTAQISQVLSCVGPIVLLGGASMNPLGPLIALSSTAISLPLLSFSRRYLHGERMFGRFSALSVGLLLGFNIVAVAPSLDYVLAGWSLFGFASTFLIGAYNERPTVRNNATFAFAAYRISDFALLTATSFHTFTEGACHPAIAGSLLLAAIFKSSQWPLTSLFVRSMEGPTPASSLGYAGLSAHVGVVLLSSTMDMWFPYDWARLLLGSVGMSTAVYGSLMAKIRSDRKGSLAAATSATLGSIFTILALGYPDLALLLSLGHASFRIIQILRSPNFPNDCDSLRKDLGSDVGSKVLPLPLYNLCWKLRRYDSDFNLFSLLHWISRPLYRSKPLQLSKLGQWGLTGLGVVAAGFPFTPVSYLLDEAIMELLPHNPVAAFSIMGTHFAVSVCIIRYLFLNVLNNRRFTEATTQSKS